MAVTVRAGVMTSDRTARAVRQTWTAWENALEGPVTPAGPEAAE